MYHVASKLRTASDIFHYCKSVQSKRKTGLERKARQVRAGEETKMDKIARKTRTAAITGDK